MKKASKIVILFSAVYLLCLQLLFGLHSLQHVAADISPHDGGNPSTIEMPACDLCDLFFDQTAESAPKEQEIVLSLCDCPFLPGDEQGGFSRSSSTFLRGPPAVISRINYNQVLEE